MSLLYSVDRIPTIEQFRAVLHRSTLGERRPVDDDALSAMLRHANLVATCWDGETLVGVARSLTDFVFCCYLSDLAVDAAHQKRGIGKSLIATTQSALGPRCKIILLAAPAAVHYYPRIGFEHHPQAWTLSPKASVDREN